MRICVLSFVIVLGLTTAWIGGATAAPFVNTSEIVAPEYTEDIEAVLPRETSDPEEAIESYQQMIEISARPGGRDFALALDKESRSYVGLRAYAIGRIRQMKNGVRLYRQVYGAKANRLQPTKKKSQSIDAWAKVIGQYPLTLASRTALQRIGEIHFQSARFEPALASWERTISEFPEDQPLSPMNLARAGYVSTALSRPATLGALEALAKKQYARDAIVVAGKKQTLPAYLASLQPEAKRVKPAPANARVWRSAHGSRTNGRQAGFDLMPDSRRWTFAHLYRPTAIPDPIFRDESLAAHGRAQQRNGKGSSTPPLDPTPPYFPVVDGHTAYINTGMALYAIPLAGDGAPTWQAPDPYTTYSLTPYDHEDVEYACVVEDHRVYANVVLRDPQNDVMIQASWPENPNNIAYPPHARIPNRLICADAKTGKVLWKSNGRVFSSFGYVSTPLKHGNRLYAVAVERLQPKNSVYLIAVDATTGDLIYKTLVASQREKEGIKPGNPGPIPSPLAESGGQLFFSTNIGVVVAAEAATGDILWMRRYHQDLLNRFRKLDPMSGQEGPRWANNAPIVHDGVLYTTPTDSSSLLAIDTATGRMLNAMPFNKPGGKTNGRYILMAGPDRLLVVGGPVKLPPKKVVGGGNLPPKVIQGQITALSLRDPTKPRGLTGASRHADKIIKQLWSWSLPDLAGRPAVSRSRIYLPTHSALMTYDLASGKPLKASLPWRLLATPNASRRDRTPGARTAGNLLVVDGLILSSSRYEISALHRLEDRVATLTSQGQRGGLRGAVMAERALAQTYLAAGKTEKADQLLAKALARLGKQDWPILDGSWPTSVRGKQIYRPRTLGIRDDLTARRLGTSYELAESDIRNKRFKKAEKRLNGIEAARITGHEKWIAISLDGSSPNTPRADVLPRQFQYAQARLMARGARVLLQIGRGNAELAAKRYAAARKAYAVGATLWEKQRPYIGLPPFGSPAWPSRGHTAEQIDTALLAGRLLSYSQEGRQLLLAGKSEKALSLLKQGMITNQYALPSGKSMTGFALAGSKATSVKNVAEQTRADLRRIYLQTYHLILKTASPGADGVLADMKKYAVGKQEQISLLVAEALVYEKLGPDWRDRAKKAYAALTKKHGLVIHRFEDGKKRKIADYVQARLKALNPKPKTPPKPTPAPKETKKKTG